MKAQVLTTIGNIEYKEVPPPLGGKIVKVRAAGICGSDIPRTYVNGAHKMPLILGHEFAGEIEEDGQTRRVGVFPLIPCGKCPQCLSGQYEMCDDYDYLGSRSNGGFAEYVAVPDWNLIDLPDEVSFEQAAMLEPMAVAVHAMRQIYSEGHDLKVVVSGLGTIGLLLVGFLIDVGVNPENIYTLGNKNLQKEKVMELGVPEDNYLDTTTVYNNAGDAAKTDRVTNISVTDWIRSKTDNLGPDLYYECIGINASVNWGIDSIRPGGKLCLVGNPASDMTIDRDTYWKILRRQVEIHGTWNSSYRADWEYVLERLVAGNIHPERLITHRYDLAHLEDGLQLMRDKSEPYIKVMVSALIL